MLKNRIIRAVLPREASPLLQDLVSATGWEPGRIIAHALAELAVRLLEASRSIDEHDHEGEHPWN